MGPNEETWDIKYVQHAQLIPNCQLLIPKLVPGLVDGFEFDRGNCTGRNRLRYCGLMAPLKQIPHLQIPIIRANEEDGRAGGAPPATRHAGRSTGRHHDRLLGANAPNLECPVPHTHVIVCQLSNWMPLYPCGRSVVPLADLFHGQLVFFLLHPKLHGHRHLFFVFNRGPTDDTEFPILTGAAHAVRIDGLGLQEHPQSRHFAGTIWPGQLHFDEGGPGHLPVGAPPSFLAGLAQLVGTDVLSSNVPYEHEPVAADTCKLMGELIWCRS
mmetsp:Transcript_143319/g.250169  ORF Transcript_143319/g.250169 Transcript_143319/m.250169 type:complete len:269 (+) Transcript_143319:1666-2472(+)